MSPRLKLVLFTSKDCGTCMHVKKNVLPLFKKANPDLKIEEVMIGLDGASDNQQGEDRANAYGIEGLPAIRFEIEGLPTGGAGNCSLSGLNALVKAAREAVANAK